MDAALRDYVALTHVSTLREAVAAAKKIAQQNDVVLLSPACSSLDQFKNYVARGEDFIKAVHDATVEKST